MKKLVSLIMAVIMVLGVSLAMAKTVEPEGADIERLARRTVHATVGNYDADSKTFTVTVYENDHFDDDDVRRLAVGDTILAGGTLHTIKAIDKLDGDDLFVCDDGEDIYFTRSMDDDDELIARTTMDDRIYMRAIAIVKLPAAEGIVYEDNTNPDLDGKAVIHEGLENVLNAQKKMETESIGFDYYSTTITLNENLEIVKIHQDFDVAM